MKNINFLAKSALIATFYVCVTLLLAPISFGVFQLRISEALCILAFFYPEAIIGLFIGCLISNIFAGLGLLDIIFGSLATLVSGLLSYKTHNIFIASFYITIINALCIGCILAYLADIPIWLGFMSLFISEGIATFLVGIPLSRLLRLAKH